MKIIPYMPRFIPKSVKLKMKRKFKIPHMHLSLLKLKQNGFRPNWAIDVGAFVGEWTLMLKSIFPDTAALMIEPLSEKKPFLEKICKDYPDCQYVSALVGAEEKEKIPFIIRESGSHLPLHSMKENTRYVQLPLTTLDKLTSGSPFSKSNFLKLDIQGYELEALKGAKSVLETVEVIVMEISLIPIDNAPIFYDVIKFMDEQNFRLYDICTFWYRPLDGGLWQIDAFFCKKTSHLVASNNWV